MDGILICYMKQSLHLVKYTSKDIFLALKSMWYVCPFKYNVIIF